MTEKEFKTKSAELDYEHELEVKRLELEHKLLLHKERLKQEVKEEEQNRKTKEWMARVDAKSAYG